MEKVTSPGFGHKPVDGGKNVVTTLDFNKKRPLIQLSRCSSDWSLTLQESRDYPQAYRHAEQLDLFGRLSSHGKRGILPRSQHLACIPLIHSLCLDMINNQSMYTVWTELCYLRNCSR